MPRFVAPLLLVAALTLAGAPDASACGGYFIPGATQTQSTQVTGHRMALSISQTESTLWDEITYDGDPASFAWVLPIKGMVTVGLSSDVLFEKLASRTEVTLHSPTYQCFVPSCGDGDTTHATAVAGGGPQLGGDDEETPVKVIAQAAVGPYEMVQLSSQDPNALADWMTSHGFAIPADVEPVLAAYLNEGFDFLALRLLPGQGVAAMRPVRVTTPGASPTLPLRMVTAGAGATVPITLWVLGEGRYEPSNFPSFEIDENDLGWSWADTASNYDDLRYAGFAANQGRTWLVEAGEPMSPFGIEDELTKLANTDPVKSGYADDQGMGAPDACAADLAALFGGIDPTSLWATRMSAALPRAALSADLALGAAAVQAPVQREFYVSTSFDEPPCPSTPGCPSDPSTGSGMGAGGAGGAGGAPTASGCAVRGDAGSPAMATMFGLGLGLALAFARRRRS